MTTTAAAWRHVDGVVEDDECWGGGIAENGSLVCGCTTPTPDPASPCGYGGCEPGDLITHAPCEFWLVLEHPWSGCHPHQPTRCTCGHSLEAVR